MATIEQERSPGPPPPPSPRPRRSGPFRWTVEQLYWLDRWGLFEDRHVELLDGVLYEMTIHPPHAVATDLCAEALRRILEGGGHVRVQQPLDLGRRSMPEPDVAVVRGSSRDYVRSHPTTALLLVEVADSTLRKDRGSKMSSYARAGIPEYWILNLIDRQLEVYRNPGPDPDRKGRHKYHDVTIVPADGSICPLVKPEARLAIADLLP